MRFHLVYSGPLAPTGNKPRPEDVRKIREVLIPQLRNLWATHHALQILPTTALQRNHSVPQPGLILTPGGPATPHQTAKMVPGSYIDLCAPIPVGQHEYRPLVRKSLWLNCEISVLFLRQQDPGELISQGGDLDNRIKTLLDALRIPSVQEQDAAPTKEKEVYCLMESDTLVSSLNVDTDRLLFPKTEFPNEVHLVIEVSLVVLRVTAENTCLL